MELFNEAKNKDYDIVMSIINDIMERPDKSISRQEAAVRINEQGIDPSFSLERMLLPEYTHMDENSREEGGESDEGLHILHRNRNKTYSLNIEAPVPVQPFLLEKVWLKYMIKHPYVRFFLDKAALLKLEKALSNYPELIREDALYIQNRAAAQAPLDESLGRNLNTCLFAIRNDKYICYDYMTHDQEILHGKRSIPYKIEYSVRDQIFYLLHYSLDDNRPVKSILHMFGRLESYTPEKTVAPSGDIPLHAIFNKRVQEPIILVIRNEKNILERTLLTFSCFEREAAFLREQDLHELKVFYYSFEEADVVSRILSLGKLVMVKSPLRIQQELREKIRKSLERYS